MSEPQPTIHEQYREARRELQIRERIFPTWVAKGTMDQPTADLRLHIMRAIVQTLHMLCADAPESPTVARNEPELPF